MKQLNDYEDELVKYVQRELQNKISLSETKLTNLIGEKKENYHELF